MNNCDSNHCNHDNMRNSSNIVRNSGFEKPISSDFNNKSWRTCGVVKRTSIPSLVHSGKFAAFLSESASIEQKIFRVTPNSQYEFSFFAKFGDRKDEEKKEQEERNRRNNNDTENDNKKKDGNEEKNKNSDNNKDSSNNESNKETNKESNKETSKETSKEVNSQTITTNETSNQSSSDDQNTDKNTDKNSDKNSEKHDGNNNKDGKSKKGHMNHNDDLGLEATIVFLTTKKEYIVTKISIEPGSLSNNYVFYHAVTPFTPCNIIAIIVSFNVTDAAIRLHVPHHVGVCIDEVSLNRIK